MDTQPHPFDVCTVCALSEEARALLDVMRPHCDGAIEEHMGSRSQYSSRIATIRNTHGEPLTLHLSRTLEECQPSIAIMTGICAGDVEQVKNGPTLNSRFLVKGATDAKRLSSSRCGPIL